MNKYLGLLGFIIFGFQLNAQEPNDCVNAVTVCGNGSFLSNATGSGNDFEINSCGGFENNSLWLEVNIVQAGTLGFDLIPNDPDILVDYDFWVFGPNRMCSNLGNPIRCATTNPNEAGLPNNLTGINGSTTLTQTGPGANGNGYVFWLNVNVGESYFIVIDRPVGDGGFELQWTGTANAGTGAFPATPDATEIEDVIQCSSTPDIAIFDLNGLRNSINADPANTVEFYENLADATDDINELPGIYANTLNPQTIYAKVKSSGTDCYTIVDFDLIVSPIPEASLTVSSNAICQGDTVTFTITGTPNATVNYNFDGGATQQILLNATGIEDITLSPTVNTQLNIETAQVINSDGTVICSQGLTVSETVTVTSNTTPVIINNSPICEGEIGALQFLGDPNATITYTLDAGVPQTFNLDATGDFSLTFAGLTTNVSVEIISVTGAVFPNCVSILNTIETIEVNPLPTVIDPDPLLVCNDGTNPNSASFNLDDESGTISNNQPNVTVSYYETQLLAQTGNPIDAIVSPYNSTSANQTIFVRLETNLGCVDFTTLNLQVIDAPIANIALPLQACDTNNLGFASFDLTQSEAEIIAGNMQPVQVTYYIFETEAEAGSPAIIDPTAFQNTIPYNQTIFARVDFNGADCYNISALDLDVFNTPNISALQPLEICDDISGDGIAQFNLEIQTPIALNSATDVSITYHLSLPDAEDGLNDLVSPYTSIGSFQTIYIRAENDFNTDCYAIASFNLIVVPLPLVINPTPLQVCDDGNPDGITSIDLTIKDLEVTGGNLGYTVSYHVTQIDADNNINALLIPYTNMANGQIVFVRVEDNLTSCFTTTTLQLIVEQAPIANIPTPLEYCDPDSDNFGFFDLTSKDDEITGGDPTLSVTYHETITDADNNVNSIASPYANIVQNSQIIYARVESSTIATDCDTIVPLQIIVNQTPQLGAVSPLPLEVCDDISADGFAQFNLTSKIPEILQNLADPTLYTVAFYNNEIDADTAINSIINSANYTNTIVFNEIIWIRVEDNTSGCYKLTTLALIVNPLPVLVQPNPLELCDDNNTGDEIEEFSFEAAANEILNGQPGVGLSYFETQLDADNNINFISSPYTNTSNPQTIFVKATNNITGCESSITLTLRVNPIPSPATPTDLEVCDEDNDGFTSFNLEEKTIEIIGGEQNITISYHETLEDANTGSFPIASPYTNIVMNQQTIYVRATNIITGCYNNLETLTIRVLEIPEVPLQITDYIICDTNTDGFAQFDLTTKNPEIIDAQTAVGLTYHVLQADALSGNNPIINTNSFTNLSNPQTIYVRLQNDNNICFDTGFFQISVEFPPEAIQPTPLELCDDETADEITIFDLTLKNDEITGGESSWSVSYYETLLNALSQTDAVNAQAYSNSSVGGLAANPQTLFAVVTDTDTGCTDIITLTIRVLPNPTPTQVLPDLELCDDNNAGDLVELFDLTTNEVLMFNGETNVSATYFETFEAAQEGIDAIPDPTQYVNISTPQVIYTRVSNNITGCFAIVNFILIVNPLPDVIAVTDFIECELNTDGFYNFNLSMKDAEVLNGQDAALYNITYHTTQQDADNVINALVSPYINVSNPQQIFVAITNINTECSASNIIFNIEVQEAAQANADLDTIVYEVCNDEMDTDNDTTNNTAVFNLSTQNPEVLDGQNPADYIVTYYASEVDAELAVNSLNIIYENTINPQIIWARVDNNVLDGLGVDTSICYEIAPLTLQVNLRPQFNLDDSYILCLNTNGTEVLETLVIDTGLLAANYTFQWSYNAVLIPTETGSSIMPTQGGMYSVMVTDVSSSIVTNCTSTATTEVILSEPPTLEVNFVSQIFTGNNVIQALAQGNGDYEYSLDDGPWQDEGLFTNVSIGQHQITARDKKGCGFVIEPIFVIGYPLYFTPNGDGNNDTWNIEGIGSDAKLYIFDRYGKLLKQLNPEGIGWNGTFNGNMMPTNDYWFTVQYTEPITGNKKEFRAHFTLKR